MTDIIREQRARAWVVVLGVAALACVFGAFLFALSSCHDLRPVEPGPMQPATCEAACARLAKLDCPEAQPNRAQMSCTEVCERASLLRDMHLGCVANAADQDSLRECQSVRCLW